MTVSAFELDSIGVSRIPPFDAPMVCGTSFLLIVVFSMSLMSVFAMTVSGLPSIIPTFPGRVFVGKIVSLTGSELWFIPTLPARVFVVRFLKVPSGNESCALCLLIKFAANLTGGNFVL